ncbi:MAG: S-methyl-5-thioribose-1-phosphate isomerase, partial [Chloroflexi bacterium]|nr:S-methyl-5-thioribose-1-phosphate isomerase [Chloroflexota bacterium]
MNTIELVQGKVRLIDQTLLPGSQVILEIDDYRGMIEAVQSLRVRGAPALGVAAACAIVLGAEKIPATEREQFLRELQAIADEVVAARPTAVNMAWAARRMMAAARQAGDVASIKATLTSEAVRLQTEDVETNRRLGAVGAAL